MNQRLIDAGELMKNLSKTLNLIPKSSDVKLVIECTIAKMPTINPVRYGHWIARKYWLNYECSECGSIEPVESNYCPWCGAKMDEVEE